MIRSIEIQTLRGINVIDDETNDIARIEPRRINIFLDCTTHMKQDLMEALALAIYLRGPRSEERLRLLKRMNDDNLWIHYFLQRNLMMSVDGFKVTRASAIEVKHLWNETRMPIGIKLEAPNGNLVRVLGVDIDFQTNIPTMRHVDIIIDEKYIDRNLSIFPLAIHEYLPPKDVEAVSKITDFNKALPLLNQIFRENFMEEIQFDNISVKTDMYGRLGLYLSDRKKREARLPDIGKGMLTLTLLALASTNNIVVLDHVEDQLYRVVHNLIGQLIALSESQWFVGMYNYPMLHSILTQRPNDTMLYVLTREKRNILSIGVTKGEEFDIHNISKAICLNG